MNRIPRKPRTVFKKRHNLGVSKAKLNPVSCDVVEISNTTGRPTLSESNVKTVDPVPKPSISGKKIGDLDHVYSKFSSEENVNIAVNLYLLSDALFHSVVCSDCGNSGIQIRLVSSICLASNLEICCKNCSLRYDFITSNKLKGKPKLFENNVRVVYGLRSIGKGQKAAQTLCGITNLPPPPTHFESYIDVLGSAAEDVCFESMKDAVEEAVDVNNGERDIVVAIDGTWQKRGHTSFNGVITATSFDMGKVIDISIKAKYCKCPNKESHSPFNNNSHKAISFSNQ